MADQETDGGIFKYFSSGATILGFVVDSIAIISIFVSLSLGEEVPSFISAELAFGILILAAFSYFGWLHSYWTKSQKGYSSRFGDFIVNDLIISFRSPKHSFPMAVLTVTYFLITGPQLREDGASFLGIMAVIGFICVGFGVFTIGILKAAELAESGQKEKKEKYQTFKKKVDRNWSLWERRVEEELQNMPYISKYSFNYLYYTEEIPDGGINYVLAKYAKLHRDKAEFGTIWKLSDEKFYRDEVLKNLEYLENQDDFF